MSNIYCVVFLFCFSSSCVPFVAIFDCPFGILVGFSYFTFLYCTVKPVYKELSSEHEIVALRNSCHLYTGNNYMHY